MSNKRKIYLFTLLCLCLSITNFSYSFKLKQLLPHSRNPSSKRLFCNLQDNFYEVEKNTFYRSKQLSDKKLKFYIKKFNIKTIINLRGNNKNAKWWQREKKVTIQKRIHFYNIPMSAKYLPCRPNLLYLLHIYQNAPRPILIHCLGGADRTGEASAIWLMDQQKKTKREALKQLSIRYSHIAYKRPAKRFFIKIWQDRKWAQTKYNPKQYPKHYKFN